MSYNSTVGPKDSQTLNQKIVDLSGATSGYQETLVSGTNIKTINGQSILGSGNINAGGKIMLPAAISDFYAANTNNILVSGLDSTLKSTLLDIYNSYSANPENAIGVFVASFKRADVEGNVTYKVLCNRATLKVYESILAIPDTLVFGFDFYTYPTSVSNLDIVKLELELFMTGSSIDGLVNYVSITI